VDPRSRLSCPPPQIVPDTDHTNRPLESQPWWWFTSLGAVLARLVLLSRNLAWFHTNRRDEIPSSLADGCSHINQLGGIASLLADALWWMKMQALGPEVAGSKEIADLAAKFVMINVHDDEENTTEEGFRPDGGYIPRSQITRAHTSHRKYHAMLLGRCIRKETRGKVDCNLTLECLQDNFLWRPPRGGPEWLLQQGGQRQVQGQCASASSDQNSILCIN
jgi:hypothetical protein